MALHDETVEPLRRHVSDGELTQALASPDNKAVMAKVLRQYKGLLHPDDLENCGLHALWRALGYHREGKGKKFTTNLHWFVECEVRRELRRQRSQRRGEVSLSEGLGLAIDERTEDDPVREDARHLGECLTQLSPVDQTYLKECYIDMLTLGEIGAKHRCSRETVRKRIRLAVTNLKALFAGTQVPVYLQEV